MYKSILQFCEKETINLDKLGARFFEQPTDMASFIDGVQKIVVKLGM